MRDPPGTPDRRRRADADRGRAARRSRRASRAASSTPRSTCCETCATASSRAPTSPTPRATRPRRRSRAPRRRSRDAPALADARRAPRSRPSRRRRRRARNAALRAALVDGADGDRRAARADAARAGARRRSPSTSAPQTMRDVAVPEAVDARARSREADDHADPLRRLPDPPDGRADRAARDRRPQLLRSLLLQRLQHATATLFFAAALGVYPNRRVMDAAFSVVHDGRQWVVRASRLAPARAHRDARRPDHRRGRRAAPRAARCASTPNAHGLAADLTFTRPHRADRGAALHRIASTGRLVMDSTRLTQFGAWEGTITVDGDAHRRSTPARDARLPATARGASARSASPRAARPACCRSSSGCGRRSTSTTSARTSTSTRTATGRRWHANGNLARVRRVRRRRDRVRRRPSSTRSAWQPGTRRAAARRRSRSRRTARRRSRSTSSRSSPSRCAGLGYLRPRVGPRHVEGRGRRRRRASGRSPTSIRSILATSTCSRCVAPAWRDARASACSSSW